MMNPIMSPITNSFKRISNNAVIDRDVVNTSISKEGIMKIAILKATPTRNKPGIACRLNSGITEKIANILGIAT